MEMEIEGKRKGIGVKVEQKLLGRVQRISGNRGGSL
jgi:hypothetical protein